jgi:hypothetical protein
MRNLMVGALLALAATTPAFAAGRACTAKAEGALGDSVQVDFTVGAGGVAGDRQVEWSPPSKDKGLSPMLSIFYALDGAKLGEPTALAVGGMIEMDKLPKDDDAAMVVRLDGDSKSAVVTPWNMYHQNIKALRAGSAPGVPPGGKPAGFYGVVPIASAGTAGQPPRNAELLAKLAGAKAMDVLIVGAKVTRDAAGHTSGSLTDMIAGKLYDLSDHAGRDALLAKALADAQDMAKHPERCGKPG